MKNIIRKTVCILAAVMMLAVPSLSEASAKMPARSEDVITDTTGKITSKEKKKLSIQLDEKFAEIGVTPYVLVTEDVPKDISLDNYARKVRNSWHIKTKDALIIIVSDRGFGLCGPMENERESSNGIDDILRPYQEDAIRDKSVIKSAKSRHYAVALKQMNQQDISYSYFRDLVIPIICVMISPIIFFFVVILYRGVVDKVTNRIVHGWW